jgi:uncharacterized surface protein with fasciclin (FAS1) repeats
MSIRKTTAAAVIALVATTALGSAPTATAQDAKTSSRGTTSLAEVLAADGNKFDRTARDFDIVHRAVTRVLKAKPNSAVAVLADGDVRLTAFIPRDQAFRRLVRDLTGDRKESEKAVFRTLVRTAGIGTVESVLLYHVVPGAPINAARASSSDGAKLKTALDGATFTVNVRDNGTIWLRDKDRDDRNPMIRPKQTDINKGNRQIAHGIDRVLRPVNL